MIPSFSSGDRSPLEAFTTALEMATRSSAPASFDTCAANAAPTSALWRPFFSLPPIFLSAARLLMIDQNEGKIMRTTGTVVMKMLPP